MQENIAKKEAAYLKHVRGKLKKAGLTYEKVALAHGCRTANVTNVLAGRSASRPLMQTINALLEQKQSKKNGVIND